MFDWQADTAGKSGGRWWVLHTKARQEKAVAAALETQHVDYYLPLALKKRTYGRRVVSKRIPLFPGYLFVHGEEAQRMVALKTGRIANVIPVRDQDRFTAELQQIYRIIEQDTPVVLYAGLQKGERCRITEGSLKDIEGVVVSVRNNYRMHIEATVLGQSVVIEVDSGLLEPID